jgi:glutaryl-CoA dehydrogenase (non-decarboxylating)
VNEQQVRPRERGPAGPPDRPVPADDAQRVRDRHPAEPEPPEEPVRAGSGEGTAAVETLVESVAEHHAAHARPDRPPERIQLASEHAGADAWSVVRRDAGGAEPGEVLGAGRGLRRLEPADEAEAEPRAKEVSGLERPADRVDDRREVDVDAAAAKRPPRCATGGPGVGDASVAGRRLAGRQPWIRTDLPAFLVDEDEGARWTRRRPVPAAHDDAADSRRGRQARDDDNSRLLPRCRRRPGLGRHRGRGGCEEQREHRLDEGLQAHAETVAGAAATTLPAVDFDLTPEQREVQATVRQFVDERVLPDAIENDINHHLDLGVIEGMAELGLLGIVIPEEHGGAGMDFVCEALACEEIERGEAAFRTLVSVHVGLNSLALLRYATEELKQRYLTPQARGEKLACFGLTEPAAGSDVAAMRTTARPEGDVYVLNGQKNWISYAAVADHALVFAKTDPEAKHKGISAFVVEREWPGVSAQETENKLGIWAGSTGELFFENVEVPAENLVGEEGQGFEIAMYGLDQGRFTVAAGACGVIRACLERSVEYARERETFGRPIGKNQFVQDMIAEMVLAYETSKLLVMQAAWLKDRGVRNTRETSLAKWHATESAFRAAHLAIQVHGAYGYSAEYGIERYFRNARAPIIYEGTTQIHKMMQAEHALGYRNLNGREGDVSPIASWAPALLARS